MNHSSLPHDSARAHVLGQATFIDDMPPLDGEVYVDVFYSPVAHGRILSLELKEAQDLDGVVAIFTHEDLQYNKWGPIIHDQPFLAKDEVNYIGEPIAIIVAESKHVAREARLLIKVQIKELPAILSIDEAREKKYFLGEEQRIGVGDVVSEFQNAAHIIQGCIEIAGQDHFYLESQSAIAYPREINELEIHSSSQHPTEVQHVAAQVLGIPYSNIVSIVKRMGGGFGGKESQASHIAGMAAVAAYRLKRPARIILEKDDDMIMTGQRHPFKNHYKVAFTNEGKITALKANLFANGGAYHDLSMPILQRALFHMDNAYFLPNCEIHGQVCRTNISPNTAFRGFGGPQAVMTIECIIEEIAQYLKKDALEIRKINCYQHDHSNTTPYGQVIEKNTLPQLFDQIEKSSDYQNRMKNVISFNQGSTTQLKGLSLTPVKFGISFTKSLLNQGSAQVNIQTDGTVQVSTGATEMGQGVNTKILQIVSDAFGISPDFVRVMPTSTEKNSNTSATAASSGTDINGSAALIASNNIKNRLKNIAAQYFERSKNDDTEIKLSETIHTDHIEFKNDRVINKSNLEQQISFKELIQLAYINRVSLSDVGFYTTKGIYFDANTGKGRPFLYYTNGVAATEVLIDRWTGELKVLRSDILMDLGRSINRAIDIGQIAGAFIQGMGWVSTEEMVYSKKGELLSHSPTTYKIPNIQDIPREFNIDLFDNDQNTENIYGSKASGEPPFLLCASVWTAVKHAISFLSEGQPVSLNLPATPEEILRLISLYS